MDITQSVYDPSLLLSPSTTTALLLCIDVTCNVMTEEYLSIEEKVTSSFKRKNIQFSPIDFKCIDILQDDGRVTLSQDTYTAKTMIEDLKLDSVTEMNNNQEINYEEVKTIQSDAGKLALLATGTAPLAPFQASAALQGRKNNPRTIQTLINTRNTLR